MTKIPKRSQTSEPHKKNVFPFQAKTFHISSILSDFIKLCTQFDALNQTIYLIGNRRLVIKTKCLYFGIQSFIKESLALTLFMKKEIATGNGIVKKIYIIQKLKKEIQA